MTTNQPSVFIVDDDLAVRDSLSLLLGLKGMRTQAFESAEEFLDTYDGEWPGCLVLDLRMPGMSGTELLSTLRTRDFNIPVIMITAHGDVAAARAAFKAGAMDFIEKPIDDEVLTDTIQSALARDAETRCPTGEAADVNTRMERLTMRERQVLALVAEGRHNREIAASLGISPRTVEVYKSRMMEKLQVRRLPDLIRLVLNLEKGKLPAGDETLSNGASSAQKA